MEHLRIADDDDLEKQIPLHLLFRCGYKNLEIILLTTIKATNTV